MKTVYELVLEEIERIVKIKGGRGFGPGAVYKPAGPKSKLGKSFVEYEMEELDLAHQKKAYDEKQQKTKVSKAFKEEDVRDNWNLQKTT